MQTAQLGHVLGSGTGRRVARPGGRAYIEVRGVHQPGTSVAARAVERALTELPGSSAPRSPPRWAAWIVTGPELDEIDDETLAGELPDVAVFARVSPEQKARIVRGLRESGRVVAVTGDGANDAPAIRLANVGIALGVGATPSGPGGRRRRGD